MQLLTYSTLLTMKFLLRLRKWISNLWCSLGWHDYKYNNYHLGVNNSFFYLQKCSNCKKERYKPYPNKIIE